MQLKDKLALAAGALLGVTANTQAAEETPWKVDTAVLYYSETDGRVQAAEPVIQLSKDWGDEHISTFKFVYDSLTGASPNGAMTAGNDRTQVFTGPSGNSRYSIAAGETPLDDSFHDSRGALRAGWQQPWGENSKVSIGANLSSEYDFASVSIDGNYALDFNEKNSTFAVGFNIEMDDIKPVGGIHQGLTATPVLSGADDSLELHYEGEKIKSDRKQVVDFLMGYTQIFSRRFLMQFNFSSSQASGYQSDPYKLLTVADQGNLMLNPHPQNTNGQYLYWFESRPEDRSKNSFFVQAKYTPGEDVIDLSYRYMSDDWGIKSSTFDARYRYEWGDGWYVEPHVRWYTQTAADFYKPYLQAGIDTDATGQTSNIDYASADPRLAEFDATTVGFKVGKVLASGSEIAVRLESYKQSGGDVVDAPAGSDLFGQNSFTELSASWIQVNYSFRW